MQRAIELAQRAQGCTSPNPLVGCVVVKNDQLVGSGWHRAAGQAHAEAEALHQAGDQCAGATLYVSLEPCCHHGRTPPCTDAIIASGISKVIYAATDINPKATGGAALLRQAGIETIHGVLEPQALQLNRFYFHHLRTGRPYVITKFAASLDGRIATRSMNSQWITGIEARQRGHQLRQAVDAIVVGAQTVISDDPQLTVRRESLNKDQITHNIPLQHPLRVVLDSHGRIPLDRKIFAANFASNTLVVTTAAMPDAHQQSLEQQGVEVLRVEQSAQQQIDVNALLSALGRRGIQSVMVEGGASLLGSFYDLQCVNEVWAFLAPKLIGGRDAPAAIAGLGIDQLHSAAIVQDMQTEQLGPDLLIRGQLEFGAPET